MDPIMLHSAGCQALRDWTGDRGDSIKPSEREALERLIKPDLPRSADVAMDCCNRRDAETPGNAGIEDVRSMAVCVYDGRTMSAAQFANQSALAAIRAGGKGQRDCVDAGLLQGGQERMISARLIHDRCHADRVAAIALSRRECPHNSF